MTTAPKTPRSLQALQLQPGSAVLGAPFVVPVAPAGMPDPVFVAGSSSACSLLNVDPGSLAAAVDELSGNRLLPGSQPVASVYAGHQFGVWAGRLGDGRALLLGEHAGWELQLKGAGLTPYSRMADGRAVLRSSIREFLCSEAMAALGIPTTRALSITASRLPVQRESIETAAVVLRLAPSFLRFGHVEHFSYSRQHDALRTLLDALIRQHYPTLADAPNPHAALLAEVCRLTGELVAAWQSVGFTHGVLNTDNMSLLGLTIDYGPFAFMDRFQFAHVPNHSDERGRYAWANQPAIGWWNCQALAVALRPLLGDAADDTIADALTCYQSACERGLLDRFRAKLGLVQPLDDDAAFLQALLECLERNRVDFTLFFRRLGAVPASVPETPAGHAADDALISLFNKPAEGLAWLGRYRERLRQEDSRDERQARMNAVNPKYILRTHLAENAIRAARYHLESSSPATDPGDAFDEVRKLLDILSRPFDEQPGHEAYAALPPDWADEIQLSCSS